MVFIMLMSLAAFLTQLAILNILRYNHTIAVLATTLKKSAGDTSNALVCVALMMTSFAAYMHVEYGRSLSDYRSMMRTYAAQFSGFMGVFDYRGVYEAKGAIGAAMLILYLLIILLLFLNVFIAILSEYMSAIRRDPRSVPADHEVVKHMMCMVQDAVGIESKETQQRRRLMERLSKSYSAAINVRGRNTCTFTCTCTYMYM